MAKRARISSRPFSQRTRTLMTSTKPSSFSPVEGEACNMPDKASHGEMLLCVVCSRQKLEPSVKAYYGGRVCQSCRVFFRRSVLTSRKFACTCRRKDLKNQCRKCRFKKCLEMAGLDPRLVKVTNKDGSMNSKPAAGYLALLKGSEMLDMDCISHGKQQALLQAFKNSSKIFAFSFFDFFLEHPKEIENYMVVLSGYGLSLTQDMQIKISSLKERSIFHFCLQLEEVKSLSGNDKRIVLSEGLKNLSGSLIAWFDLACVMKR